MEVSLPAQLSVVDADGRRCTWVYETANETVAAPAALAGSEFEHV
jgi:hypothetical protein